MTKKAILAVSFGTTFPETDKKQSELQKKRLGLRFQIMTSLGHLHLESFGNELKKMKEFELMMLIQHCQNYVIRDTQKYMSNLYMLFQGLNIT